MKARTTLSGLTATATDDRLPLSTIWAYCLPTVGLGFMGLLFSIALMKFSTDVLLVAPAAMGLLLGMGRIWDGISDPVAGYLSDRSTAARGRRRSWMYASAIPVGITTVMLWAPPPVLDGMTLILWLGFALLVYETAMTAFLVPHGALGLELTQQYHERTRLFGYRHAISAFGLLLGLGGVFLLRTATESSAEDARSAALWIAVAGGAAMSAMIFFAATRLPERADYSGRGSASIGKSFADVFRNPHARLLFIVYGVETFGAASVGMLAPYIMQYVVKAPHLTEVFVLVYIVPQFAFAPLWIRIARHFNKKSLWLFSMCCLVLGYGTMFFISEGSYLLIFTTVFLLGLGGGCGAVVAPSIQADVVDYDEYLTGERKEGAYVAIWNLVRKGAGGLTAVATGLVLQWVGYEPNVEQSESTKTAMLALMGLLPASGYAIGALMFSRFSFNEKEHAEVVAALSERGARGASSSSGTKV